MLYEKVEIIFVVITRFIAGFVSAQMVILSMIISLVLNLNVSSKSEISLRNSSGRRLVLVNLSEKDTFVE